MRIFIMPMQYEYKHIQTCQVLNTCTFILNLTCQTTSENVSLSTVQPVRI